MIQVVAIISVKDEQALKEFETQAVHIMSEFGGSLATAFATADGEEVHLIEFPDAESFERYRSDPRLVALGELRATAIASTDVYVSTTFKNYGQ